MLSPKVYSELSIKYLEALDQQISDSEMVEYLCDNTEATSEEILYFFSII